MIVDIVGGSLVVVGSVLMALGAFGLLRFPDVFTRMHAATKAATVGVIAATTGASIEAGAVGGALILLVVIALLFLSGPLGMSLLARAAYHDPETPRAPSTVELEVDLPTAESTPTNRVRGSTPLLALWLLLVWIAAFGSVAPNVVVSGVIVAAVVAYTFRVLAPRWPGSLRHPVAAWRFVAYFIGQMAVSTWDVILALRLRPDQIRPAVLEVPLRALDAQRGDAAHEFAVVHSGHGGPRAPRASLVRPRPRRPRFGSHRPRHHHDGIEDHRGIRRRPHACTVRGASVDRFTNAATYDGSMTSTANWTFLTNHSHVLLCIAENPDVRLREVAEQVQITERATQRIVAELEEAGYLSHERIGRRNHYQVNAKLPLRHALEDHLEVGALLRILAERP